jgi:arsenite-transporting ATPase
VRILLFTGKGGVGKTSIAAATSLAAAARGLRTLVMSTDPAHSLADSFEQDLGSEPTLIRERLWGQQIDTQKRLEENWREISAYAVEVLQWVGMSGIEAEELSVVPGLDEIFGLADAKHHYDSGEYDLLVIDCAPTAETLRLLSLPEIMKWYIERIFPIERRVVKAVRPVLRRMPGLPPIATDAVFDAVERFYRRIEGIREIFIDPKVTSVRLVVNPEKMVIAEARRTLTYLSLFQYRVDSVIVNRLIPDRVSDPYFERWKSIQAEHLSTIETSFNPIPILRARLFDREMVGRESLETLASEVYGELDPAGIFYSDDTMKVARGEGGYELALRLPFAERGEVDLVKVGDELFVKVGAMKRSVILPTMLQRVDVEGASLDGDWLKISFQPKVEVPAAKSTIAKDTEYEEAL